jgi:hypothetical protein
MKQWTPEEISELEKRIKEKVRDRVPLTAGEDVLWGDIKAGNPLTQRLVQEVDSMMGFDE